MASHSQDAGTDDTGGPPPASMGLACNGCRKSKLKCSRGRPACQHCRKSGIECVYETKRSKPGIKSGAVENLHRRLDALEESIRERDSEDTGSASRESNSQEKTAYNILALLAKELPKLVNASQSPEYSLARNPRKRRRHEAYDTPITVSGLEVFPQLPDRESLEAIISAYFSHIHPWIPMVHQATFRRLLEDPAEFRKREVLLHAMVISASKYTDDSQVAGGTNPYGWAIPQVRDWIVSKAMNCLSVENLQALIVIAFTDIGDGNAEKAWSIVGSLTRTVEYLQLTVEHEDGDRQPLCQPFHSLNETKDWTELEERRRVFWNVFNLDRYCSVTMGWNTSLTSDDVHRRLPCDGILWRKQVPVVTPYFGIWNKSAGRIGNPIAFIPAAYQSPGRPGADIDLQSHADAASSSGEPPAADMSTVGALAYSIEATESMSRVTSYFLQQRVNMRDHKEIGAWLTRFKELDLRLVHWKMLLPQKWSTNNFMERQTTRMDPNLTVAHVTHNTSMILLHQLIAYPPVAWSFRNRLPSSCSAETCYSAGVEIATITENYLKHTPKNLPVASQYCFCCFIAARMFLIHWRYYAEDQLAEEFWFLIKCLEEMSRRWTGQTYGEDVEHRDLAAKYAMKLRQLHHICAAEETYRINVADYTNEIDHRTTTMASPQESNTHVQPSGHIPIHRSSSIQHDRDVSGLSQSVRYGPQMSLAYGTPPSAPNLNGSSILASGMSAVGDESPLPPGPNGAGAADLSGLPPMLLDHHFMNMDRVITFHDGSMFAADLDPGGW